VPILACKVTHPIPGKIKEPNPAAEAGKGAIQAIQSYAKGDMGGVFKAGMGIFKVATGAPDKATKISRETKGSQADVVCDSLSPPTFHGYDRLC
jgi:hypothetical protein